MTDLIDRSKVLEVTGEEAHPSISRFEPNSSRHNSQSYFERRDTFTKRQYLKGSVDLGALEN